MRLDAIYGKMVSSLARTLAVDADQVEVHFAAVCVCCQLGLWLANDRLQRCISNRQWSLTLCKDNASQWRNRSVVLPVLPKFPLARLQEAELHSRKLR